MNLTPEKEAELDRLIEKADAFRLIIRDSVIYKLIERNAASGPLNISIVEDKDIDHVASMLAQRKLDLCKHGRMVCIKVPDDIAARRRTSKRMGAL